ncbi:MAG: hypothetical protein JWL62_276, partial [Hyphomicrobiales bacterium]|nr:hypothetical protein [Hyphomicrobiales bacterium]
LVSAPLLDHPAFWWLGLGTEVPRSNDWRPFVPWFGVMLVGVLLGRQIIARGLPARLSNWQPSGIGGCGLVFGGKHSLLVYLVHQPIFIAVIFVIAKIAGPQHMPASEPFAQACEAQCVTSSGNANYCKRVCGCIVEQAQAQNLWRGVMANKLSPEEHTRFTDLTKSCARFETDGNLR